MKYENVITSLDIQNAYLKFYPFMMQYLWDINTVMHLANLEIAIYKRFPDKDEMEKYVYLLEKDIDDTYRDTEILDNKEFKKSFDHLKEYISEYDKDSGLEIHNMTMAVNADEVLEESTKINPNMKDKITVGKIVKR